MVDVGQTIHVFSANGVRLAVKEGVVVDKGAAPGVSSPV